MTFPPFLTAILKFSIKRKSHFLPKIIFLSFWVAISETLRKTQKPIYLGNGAR